MLWGEDVANANGDVLAELDTSFYYHATNIYHNDSGDGVANSWLVQGVATTLATSGFCLAWLTRMRR